MAQGVAAEAPPITGGAASTSSYEKPQTVGSDATTAPVQQPAGPAQDRVLYNGKPAVFRPLHLGVDEPKE
jgi:hypothetical protein